MIELYDIKGGKIDKDVVYDMMLNMLSQLYDGITTEDVSACPCIKDYEDYGIRDVIALGFAYQR